MRRVPLVVVFVAAMLVVTATVASADTPSTSASSSTISSVSTSTCSPLKPPGGTAGLYGLCVAFCTQVDCPVEACTAGNAGTARILAQYNALKRAGDPAMPCGMIVEPPPGSCWTAAELAVIGVSYSPNIVNEFWNVYGTFSSYALVENRVVTNEFPYGAYMVASVDISDFFIECRYFNANFAPGSPEPTLRFQAITMEQAIAAQAEIDAHIQSLRAAGVPVVCVGNQCP